MYNYKDIRNFYFENEKKERIDCQKINGGLFLYNVTGLGYEENIEYEQLGDDFIPTSKKVAQNIIDGELEFYDMTYDEYRTFIDFILEATELKIIYVPKTTNREEYYRDIDVIKIAKAEEDEFNVLTSPITMACKGLWYQDEETIFNVGDTEIQWDFVWDAIFSDYKSRSIIFENDGHVESAIQIELSNHLINPTIIVTKDGTQLFELQIPITLQDGEKLLYSSKDRNLYIRKQNTDGTIENLFTQQYVDINNDIIFKLPKGESILTLKAENDILEGKVNIFKYYKAV